MHVKAEQGWRLGYRLRRHVLIWGLQMVSQREVDALTNDRNAILAAINFLLKAVRCAVYIGHTPSNIVICSNC